MMRIKLDKSSRVAMYLQIAGQIKAQIITGELAPGHKLPPERRLADSLGVNRTTILNAYRELKAEGLIDSHVGQGTVVIPVDKSQENQLDQFQKPMWSQYFNRYAERLSGRSMNILLNLANRSDVISFATGIASPECGPLDLLKGMETELLLNWGSQSLLHSPVEGFYSLRKEIAANMERKGYFCRPEEVMLLSGSQQGIDLVARILLEPGDLVITEEPTFFPALKVLQAAGARMIGVPVDHDGMQIQLLEQLLQRYHPKLIYTIPSFHNPTGVEMSLERRRKLIELAHKYKVLVLEDDAYGELCYDGEPLPTLKSIDISGYVIYLNTFSKTLYPGLRIGWVAAHRRLIKQLAASRQLVDLHTNCLSQRMIERFLLSGKLEQHLQKLCREYRGRRDLMLAALAKYAPDGLDYQKPKGGYYLWCRLPEGISAERLVEKAAAYKVVFLPGNSSFTTEKEDRHIRLNFTFAAKTEIDEGIRRLCCAIGEMQAEQERNAAEKIVDLNPIV